MSNASNHRAATSERSKNSHLDQYHQVDILHRIKSRNGSQASNEGSARNTENLRRMVGNVLNKKGNLPLKSSKSTLKNLQEPLHPGMKKRNASRNNSGQGFGIQT